jgi:DNA-binding MarR family transcriptional regulator
MEELSTDILSAVREIRDLLRLMAEPAIAQRDQKVRGELRRIVGNSGPKAKAVLLMDGTRKQSDIHRETRIDKGQLSTLVKQLNGKGLLSGDRKAPMLAISVPGNFFEAGATNE